ncbi:MAG: serine/threonine protein kinase [Gemmatimonadaceae bacterium]|nr:serine/threonine protein kinase [Gemmatimonadaceae bacterium]
MSHDPLTGTTIAGYVLEERVGEGGTATVYRATHATHGTVAFKVLREKLRHDRTAVARFLREASFGTRVLHPNVVRTIEFGQADGGLHFLAIEWAKGELLESYAKKNAPLPPDEVAEIIAQVADAVHAAHVNDIVHRDLKPENLMYDPASRTTKLLDFGIATATDVAPDDRLTRAGFFVGTLMYVAPEALSGEIVAPSADQYSLACIAYLLLTGLLPYTAKSPREMFTQLLSQPPIPLNKARPGIVYNQKVESAIMRGLAKDPKARFPSVVDFASTLTEALASSPFAAVPESGLLSRVRGIFRAKS